MPTNARRARMVTMPRPPASPIPAHLLGDASSDATDEVLAEGAERATAPAPIATGPGARVLPPKPIMRRPSEDFEPADGVAGVPENELAPDHEAPPIIAGPLGGQEPGKGLVRPSRPIPGVGAAVLPAAALPPLKQVHAAEVCPHLFPQESESFPGIFVDPRSGRAVLPPMGNRPQFAAWRLVAKNRLLPKSGKRRVIVARAHSSQAEWGLQKFEEVEEFTEVVFDGEEMRDDYLRENGVDPRYDPLAESRNVPGIRFDGDAAAANTIPGLQGMRAGAHDGGV